MSHNPNPNTDGFLFTKKYAHNGWEYGDDVGNKRGIEEERAQVWGKDRISRVGGAGKTLRKRILEIRNVGKNVGLQMYMTEKF